MKRALRIAVGLIVVWLSALLIVGAIYRSRAGERIAERVGESLLATATIDATRLGLVRGWVELDGLRVRKDGLGVLELDVGHIECDLLPLGLALVDRSCGELAVQKVRLMMTSLAALRFERPKRKPLEVDRVVIEDATLTFAASAFLPDLGAVEIRVDRVVAGPTTFKTPLSWLFAMQELEATLDLPAGIKVKLAYANGALTARGSVFGSAPVTLPIRMPTASDADDAKAELAKLAAFGRELAEELLARRAKDWLKSKLSF